MLFVRKKQLVLDDINSSKMTGVSSTLISKIIATPANVLIAIRSLNLQNSFSQIEQIAIQENKLCKSRQRIAIRKKRVMLIDRTNF